jgi:hypothetical protein
MHVGRPTDGSVQITSQQSHRSIHPREWHSPEQLTPRILRRPDTRGRAHAHPDGRVVQRRRRVKP